MTTIIPGLYGLDSATAWRVLSKDPDKYIDRFAKNKTVQKEIEYFNKKAPTFNSVDDLMKDRRALQYLLDSFGLGSEINNAGRIKKILTEDPTDPNALVNKLVDNRFKTMATSLRLDQNMNKITLNVSRETLETKYIQNEFEEALGEQDTALRQAAYFARNSNGISTVYNLMGDQILRNVVTSTFNLPQELAIQPIETQARVIAQRVDVTKFGTGTNSSVTSSQLSRAKADHDLISKSLAVSDAALKQMTALQEQLTAISNGYAQLGELTDPMGANADLIATQRDSVPELLRYEELLRKGDSTLGSVESGITSMQSLLAEAKKPGADIDALKAQFATLAASLHDRIDNANTTTFAGSENILLSGTSDPVSIALDNAGNNVTINRYDATSLKNYIDSAASAFDALTGTGDTSNLLAVEARLMFAQEGANDMRAQIGTDLNALNSAVSGTTFAASLNTDSLMRGQLSIDDGLSRITQIEDLLSQIGELAKTSKNMAAGADRSALEAQFDALKTELRDTIENAGASGLDNFLNNIGDQSYEIVDGKTILVKGNINLAATIADVLDAGSLSDAGSAAALENSAIMLTNRTDSAKAALNESKPVLDRAMSAYDPRGKLDYQIASLRTSLDAAIAAADKDGQNLLSADQSTIRLDGLSSGSSLSFRSQTDFRTDFLNALDGVMDQLSGNNPTAILNALFDVTSVVDRSKRMLTSDNRVATMEQGKLGATIDVLDPKNTSEASNTYKTNMFTEKFLTRYLTLSGSNGQNASNSYLSNLFSGSDMASATANLMSLALSLKA